MAEQFISPEEGQRIINLSKATFGGTDENGKPRYEYGRGKGTDTDGDKIPEVDCSYLVYDSLRRAGYSVSPFDTRYLNSDSSRVKRQFGEVTANNVRAGDLIVFNGHVGIVETITYDANIGKYVGTFFHSEGGKGAQRPITSKFILDSSKNIPGYSYGDSEHPVTKFLRLKKNFAPATSDNICNKCHQNFSTSKIMVSPVILDLDNDGIETTNVTNGAYFDHDSNGFAEQSGWIAPDDGLLVMDRNGDGIINDGRELFGSETLLRNGTKASVGFQALAELDDNADGKIDANDSAFSQLKVWQDIDGDGYSTTEELHTLSELGIQSINTGYSNSTFVDTNGNEHREVSIYTKADGTTGAAEDVWFKADRMFTLVTEWLEVPEDIAALPDLQGYGNVYDLQQAIVRDTSGQLKSLVEQFIATTDTTVRNSLMEQILFKWTNSDGISPTSRGAWIDARKLSVLERFFGETFYQQYQGNNPGPDAASTLNQSYQGMFEMFYAQLMSQTHLKDLYGMISYTWDDTIETVKGDLSAVTAEIQNCLNTNYEDGKKVLSEFTRTLRGFQAEDMMDFKTLRTVFASQSDELAWIIDSAGKNIIIGTAENDMLIGTKLNEALRGYEGDDNLNGGGGNDMLDGGEGNDRIYCSEGNNIVDGGAGDDYICSVLSNDTYRFGVGSGQDTIRDSVGYDTIEFGAGINSTDLELYKEGDDLHIKFKGITDSLVIQDWFDNYYTYCKIEQFKFADGTELSIADVDAMGYKVYGTEGNDTLHGTTANDEIYGYEGNDNMYGNSGDDIMDGGAGDDFLVGGNNSPTGNDTLYGGDGNDWLYDVDGNNILDGGTGNDTLWGGWESDTYIFGVGSGQDTIRDSGGYDTIEFGAGINSTDLELYKEGDDLHVKFNGITDSLVIQDWFDNYYTYCKIEQFKFADGTVLTSTDIDTMGCKVYGTSDNDYYLQGSIGTDEIYGYEGNDYLYGLGGDDTLYGGDGNDFLFGGSGDDILDGGTGNDNIWGYNGSDTYIFGRGSGQDTIWEYGDASGSNIIDTIKFGTGITISDLDFIREGDNLRIKIKDSNDALLIQYHFSLDSRYKIEQFVFVDGTVMTPSDKGYKIYGTEGNDFLSGINLSNDEIYGYNGNDTYRFGIGSGQDTIVDIGGYDTIEFGAGINSGDLELIKESNNLRIKFKGISDSLMITDWFASSICKIEQFKFADDIVLTPADIDAMGYKVYGTSGNDVLYGSSVNDEIYGGVGDDILYGGAGDDMIYGGAGSDQLYGEDGNDTLYGGGPGDDYIEGGNGNDTYLFSIGSSQDTIYDSAFYDSDTVEFGAGINSGDLELIKESNDLRIKFKGISDSLTIQKWFENNGYRINQFKFADGTIMTPADFDAMGYKVYGTSGNDVLYGSNVNDEIYGYEGDDILDGRAGNDNMWGYTGNDTYKFGIGSGQDIINNYHTTTSEIDIVEFGTGINPSDIAFIQEGMDLRINIKEGADSLLVANWFNSDNYKVSQFKFADGTIINNADIVISRAIYGTTTNESLNGSNTSDYILGDAGNDKLSGHGGNDILYGGVGDDTLIGGNGDDILDGGAGNDYLQGNAGNDIYRFDIGGGQDTIFDHDSSRGLDTVKFGAGININNLELVKEANGLRINIIGTTDSLLIQDWYKSDRAKIEQFRFADGTVLSQSEIETAVGYKIAGTTGNDILQGTSSRDVMYGYEGNDSLYGNAGNDMLDGGIGNDYLQGNSGSDIYRIGINSGQDIINDYDTTVGNTDTVKTTEGVSKEDIAFFRKDSDLYIFTSSSDFVKVTDQFNNQNYGIERIEATDGYYVSRQDIENIVNAMIDFNNDSGMDVVQRYNNLMNNQQYLGMLAQSWHQPQKWND